MRPACFALAVLATPAAAVPFEISESYAPATEPVPGTYACRSGLDIDRFTYTFDLTASTYAVHGLDAPQGSFDRDAEGTLTFTSGPFAPDDTATMLARLTTRLSDNNPVVILGYFFTDGTDSYDYCARLD